MSNTGARVTRKAHATNPGMLRSRAAPGALALSLVFGACARAPDDSVFADSTSPAEACVPGMQIACACPGGEQGAQVCNPDGESFGPCSGCDAGHGGSISASSGASGSSICGNGILEAGEECDDGNQVDADGCEASCTMICGSGAGADRATRDPSTGHCYLGFSGTPAWQDAEVSCEALGGYLAVIDSASENQLARAASLPSNGPWIGFNDIASEAFNNPYGFVKVTGGPLTFDGFAAGEPNNNAGNEDCVHFFKATDPRGPLQWNDAPCSGADFVSGFLCEIDASDPPPPPRPASAR